MNLLPYTIYSSTALYLSLPLLYFTLLGLYHGSSSLYLILHSSAMTLLHTTLFYITAPWLYFIICDCTIALLHSTSLYIILPRLYFLPLHSTAFYHGSTVIYNGSTSLYLTLLLSIPWLRFTPLDSTLLCTALLPYLDSSLLYHSSTLTLHYSIPWLYFTLFLFIAFYQGSIHSSTMTLLHSTWHYISLPNWLYFTLLYSTAFYHGSTGLYLTILFSTLLYHGSTSLYLILFALYIILPQFYFTLFSSTMALLHSILDSTAFYHTAFYHGCTSLYLILYIPLPLWLYFTLLLRKHSIIITPFCSWECMVWTWD